MPPWLRFTILTSLHVVIAQGVVIQYRIKLHGLSQKWKIIITEWDPPHCFTNTETKVLQAVGTLSYLRRG